MSAAAAELRLKRAFAYCAQQVRLHDYAHYVCALHLPPALRASVVAIRAFNAEIAPLAERIREPRLAQIRTVWWRDAVDAVFQGKAQEHPVLEALGAVVEQRRLNKRWLHRLLQARIDDVAREGPPRDVAEIEAYCESTASGLLYLSLEAAGVRDVAADHAATHIGKAEGLALLLRAAARHHQQRRTYLPLDVLAKHGVREEDLYRARSPEGLAGAVFEVASVANAHLEKARSMRASVPKAALPLFLPAVPAAEYLGALQRKHFDVFHRQLQQGGISPLGLQVRVWWHSLRGTY